MNTNKAKTPYRIYRYWSYAIATFFAVSIPFIQINNNQIFLLSFDKKQLHLMGIVFDMQELYMMPFLLMLLFLGIFAITAVGGRAWCGWACPQTIFRVIYRDLIETKILKLRRIKNKQKDPDYSKPKNKFKKIIAIILWSTLSLLIAADFMWYFVPPDDFFMYLTRPHEHPVLVGFLVGIAGFLIYDVIILKEDFCVYICPYSRVQSVLYDDDTMKAVYSENRGGKIYNQNKEKTVFKIKDLQEETNECTTCESCVTVCPTHIDIRKGTQLECINCLECVDACTSVMGKLGKESLVQWTSTNDIVHNKGLNIIRPKSIGYLIALLIIIGMLFVMGGEKEYMLLNINKTTGLYKTYPGGKVINNYVLLFQNTQKQDYTYNLEVIGEFKDQINIERFEEFQLSHGKLTKKIIRLATTEKLANNIKQDTPLTIQLKAYAKENPEKIFVLRDVVFIYPKASEIKP